MLEVQIDAATEPVAERKERGAYFTPPEITAFMAGWAIRRADDLVIEPSSGDAEFLLAATRRLQALGIERPEMTGIEIHEPSASKGAGRVADIGGHVDLRVADFFTVEPTGTYSAILGNPPYIRYQDFAGDSRTRAREAALRAGVALSALSSSWAAFTIHSAMFLRNGGRMALVLPAELLSVNYAGPVRRFLFESFKSIELVTFEEQVFDDAEADVILLLADGYRCGPADYAKVFATRNAASLTGDLVGGLIWRPDDPGAKWTSLMVDPEATEPLRSLLATGAFTHLQSWGETTLGMVTGNNRFFTLPPARVRELGLPARELVRISPPGSGHLRGLELTDNDLRRLGRLGRQTWLFRPQGDLSRAAEAYVESGHIAGVDTAYKCRVRKTWYEVPLIPPADLLLTCMNADTPRLTTNTAGARHLNSVHGVYLNTDFKALGRELLPLASLNSVTLLHAEVVGRAYGGGVLKIEPREADQWDVPSHALVQRRANRLRAVRAEVEVALTARDLLAAVRLVDRALFRDNTSLTASQLALVRKAREALFNRRAARGKTGGLR